MRALCLIAAVHAASCEVDLWLTSKVSEAELERRLYEVSDPTSAKYGQHYTLEQVRDLVSPDDADVAALKAAFPQGVLTPTADRMILPGTVKPSLPQHLRKVVREMVVRVAGPEGAPAKHIEVQASPIGAPEVREAYGIPSDATGAGQQQLVWGPGTYGVLKTDVTKYWSSFNIPNTLSNLNLTGYAGDQNGGDNFGEASLDTDIISGMAFGAMTEVSNTNNSKAPEEGPGFGYAQLAFLNELNGRATVPGVVSLSLGSLTWNSCDILCKGVAAKGQYTYAQCLQEIQYNQRQVCMFSNDIVIQQANVEFMKLGLRGVTVLAAAGDGGMHFSFQPFSPLTAMGRDLNEVACANTMPTFPASSPYVTAVGGTSWEGGSKTDPVYWNGGGSSFSWEFPMPTYQQSAVNAYLQAHSSDPEFPPPGSFNATLRAYPDVSALASGNAMVMQGNLIAAAGTSAATPTFAGVITLLNAERIKNGKGFLGFWNPALYQQAAAHQTEIFSDVTKGNSKCNSLTCATCNNGFPATTGFDLATGWGAPKWAGLVKYFG
eukprot:TRINITY_DN1529_c0_g1_i1.p1 TRINITY_DN1529_c0_g1~~TRINITY_DN1529_c0_g1_i1.p1  ORF type:complete len:564 (+),score=183.96 TRINITY_DN1529_c0_g1_i1:53-1693(+)